MQSFFRFSCMYYVNETILCIERNTPNEYSLFMNTIEIKNEYSLLANILKTCETRGLISKTFETQG